MNTGPKPIEMVGKKFGKLTVLSLDHKTKTDRYWRCQCDCGDLKVADGAELRRGTTTHCGCSNPRRSLWVHESHAKELDALPEGHPSKAQLIPEESE
jgi:hypothetical protein